LSFEVFGLVMESCFSKFLPNRAAEPLPNVSMAMDAYSMDGGNLELPISSIGQVYMLKWSNKKVITYSFARFKHEAKCAVSSKTINMKK